MKKEIWIIFDKKYKEYWCDENGWNTLDKRPTLFNSRLSAEETICEMGLEKHPNIVALKYSLIEE